MRYSASEKFEIIELVQVRQILARAADHRLRIASGSSRSRKC